MSIKNELSTLPSKDNTNFFVRVLKYFVPWRGDTFSDLVRKFVFVVSLVVFGVCVSQLVDFYYGVDEADQDIINIRDLAPSADKEPATLDPNVNAPDEMLPIWYDIYSINQDTIGWIKIDTFRADPKDENTCYINYPVMQTNDNDYYLYRDVYKNYVYGSSGTLFADYYIPITGYDRADNIVIYGHNMRSLGVKFTHLHEYKTGVDFLKSNPIIDFDTLYTQGDRYIIVSAFIGTSDESLDDEEMFDYWRYSNFTENTLSADATDEEKKEAEEDHYSFKNFYKGITERSWYSSDIKCTKDDEYISLSTCSNEVKGLRWVITARKIREDETEDDVKKMIASYKKRNDADINLPSSWVNTWGQVTMYKGWWY